MKLILPLLLFFFVFAFPDDAFATSDLVINEFSAIGDEWVEIYNTTANKINIENFIVRDSTESDTNKKVMSGYICPKSIRKVEFYNKLNNGGDTIRLFDSSGNLVDQVEYFSETVPEHQEGQSTSRQPDGENYWVKLTTSTPQNDESCNEASPTTSNQENSPSPTSITTQTAPKSSPKASPKISPSASANTKKEVLGERTSSPEATPSINSFITPAPSTEPSLAESKIANFALGGGAILVVLSIAGYLWYKWEIKKTSKEDTKSE